MHYFKKEAEVSRKGSYSLPSVLLYAAVLFVSSFSVMLGYSFLFATGPMVRWLAAFCLFFSLLCTAFWLFPIPVVIPVIMYVIIGIALFVNYNESCKNVLTALVNRSMGFQGFFSALYILVQDHQEIAVYASAYLLITAGAGLLIRKESMLLFHVSSLTVVLTQFLFGTDRLLLWEVMYIASALLWRTRKVNVFFKPFLFTSWLVLLLYPELYRIAEKLEKTRLHASVFYVLSPVIKNISTFLFPEGQLQPVPAKDIYLGEDMLAFSDVVGDFSIQRLISFFQINSIRLTVALIIFVSVIIFNVIKVRKANSELKAGSNRIRQTNRRRALQEIGEAVSRLATWQTGEKVTPWDEDFVVKTASVLPKVSGVELERMRETMNRMRYGKDEVLETDYRKALELYLQMFNAGRRTPSDAVRRRLKLPI